MPAFNKTSYISSLPVTSTIRRFSEKSEFAGQLVHPRLEDLQTPPTRNEHIIATLAHSRGELGTGCNRVSRGRRCEFGETIVLMDLWKGVRILGKCTNCHFACDNKAQCGAVPTTIFQALPEAVQPEEYAEGMERAEEPRNFALPGHVRHGRAQGELQNDQSRTTVEFTAGNIQALQAFSENSFEASSDHMLFTDPASSSELQEKEEDRKAGEEESRQTTLRNLHIREQALRRAHEIGLDTAISEVKTEREEYLGSVMKTERK